MSRKKLVVAVGRSAFGTTFPEQKKNVQRAAAAIADLAEEKYQIVLTHSNGEQIGMIHTAMTEFARIDSHYTVAPVALCGAMSQGYVGYDLQNAIRTELLNRGLATPVVTLITQVKVNPFDKAFSKPTKLIGRCMTEYEAELEEKKGNHTVKTENGYRRIIASPKPLQIYEADSIRALLDAGQIVIAGGGGGIPVFEQGTTLKGASAIIEKDLIASMLAQVIDADLLLYLTGSEKVQLHFGTDHAVALDAMNIEEATEYIDDGCFEPGRMLPKIEGAVSFVSFRAGRKAIITSIDKALAALTGKTGTVIQ